MKLATIAHSTARICLAAILAMVVCPTHVTADDDKQAKPAKQVVDWTQWRGPNRDGTVDNQNWPDSLDEKTLVKKWSVKIGPSYSGPIIVGDMVYVTETKDKKDEVVHALNRNTGEKVWSAQWEGSIKVPFFARANGDWIRSTPCYDDGRLYVGGIRDVLVCLDAKTGKEQWKIDFVKEFASSVPTFGFVCSPLIDGDDLYIQAGGGFCKIDKKTGKVKWRVLTDGGGMMGSVFSSPYIATLAGKRQILVQMREDLYGVDMETGKTLWGEKIPTFRGMNILTPVTLNDGIFLSTYGGTTQMLTVKKEGDSFTVAKQWETGKQGYMSSPVVVGKHAYLNMRNRTLACFDMESGDLKWSSPRYGQYASLITNKKKLLVLDQKGKLLLIRANPEKYDLLSERTLSKDSWAHLGIRGNQIFVRELDAITVYDWNPARKPVSASASAE